MKSSHLIVIAAILFCSFVLVVASDDSCPPGMYPNLSIGGATTKLLMSDRVIVPKVTAEEGFAFLKAYGPFGNPAINPPVIWQPITKIDILSHSSKMAIGGCVKVSGGGLGSIYATIEFQANKDHEINYTVNIYSN